jgi:hypothetical protein
VWWLQVQSDINRYHEEATAAADFFQHSSALMTNHLKNNLLQVRQRELLGLQAAAAPVATTADLGMGVSVL